MYTLRLTNYKSFIRASDGNCTDNTASAILFETVEEARAYVVNRRTTPQAHDATHLQISIVEVETKPVIHRVGLEIEVV